MTHSSALLATHLSTLTEIYLYTNNILSLQPVLHDRKELEGFLEEEQTSGHRAKGEDRQKDKEDLRTDTERCIREFEKALDRARGGLKEIKEIMRERSSTVLRQRQGCPMEGKNDRGIER